MPGLKVARPKDSMPFGMHIRKAAAKAAFGAVGGNPILVRYSTDVQKEKKSGDALDDLTDDSSSSESVSEDSSDDDLLNIEVDSTKLKLGSKPPLGAEEKKKDASKGAILGMANRPGTEINLKNPLFSDD